MELDNKQLIVLPLEPQPLLFIWKCYLCWKNNKSRNFRQLKTVTFQTRLQLQKLVVW